MRSVTNASLVRLVAALALIALPVVAPVPASAAKKPSVPDVTAKAVYSMDIDAGVVLYAKNEDVQLEPASTTKIATALLLVRNVKDLTQTVTIEQNDVNAEGESTMALQAGDVVTFNDLLYGLLLPSGNDAANAVARVVGGQLLANEGGTGDPTARFVQEMNNLAAELKMTNTVFMNPTGLHQPGHVTSAKDMTLLARKAFTNRQIRDAINTPSYDVVYQGPNARQATISTTVQLKKDGEDGVVGGKTGTTPEAGACLVLETLAGGGNRVITVLLGSEIQFDADGIQDASTDQRYADVQTILTAMRQDYRWIDVTRDNAVPGLKDELAVWDVALADDDAVVVPNEADAAISYLLQLGPEGKPEEQVGSVLFFLDNDQVAERAVVQLAPGGETAALRAA